MFHTSFFYCETFLVKKKLIPLFKVESVFKLEVPLYTEARANHPAGIAAEVVADFYLATYAQVLATEVLTYIVPELWLSSEDGVLSFVIDVSILVELHVSILVKHTSVVFPPEISETAKVQSL